MNSVSFIRLLGGGVPYGDEVTAILWANTRQTVAPGVPLHSAFWPPHAGDPYWTFYLSARVL